MGRKILPVILALCLLGGCGQGEAVPSSAESADPSAVQTYAEESRAVTTAETSAKAETSAETETTFPEVIPEEIQLPEEAYIETGTFDQYRCEPAGATACGATAGTLILQSISFAEGDELAQRMNTIRGYSALGDDYSCGAPQYYLAGFQISNSLNRYLEENGMDYKVVNHRSEKSTEETLMELIATGRPAVLEVCYGNGAILPEHQGYSHWICVNGYRTSESGVEFRYADTIANGEYYVSSELLDKSNANVSYGDFYLQPERYIAAFEDPV